MKNSENKPYNPQEIEAKIYRIWEKSGYFNPDNLPLKKSAKPFCIIMPPPNANGSLHVGHAVFVTLQDIMIRYHRMKGDKTLWLPGTDHAGFETQVVFDKKLEKEGRSRFQIPADQLYKEIMEFTLTNKKTMEDQLRKLGASCDWSREKFTLNKDIIKIVYETFEKLKQDDLLYRGQRIVNWCSKHQTSLSDLEVKYVEREDPFYYIKYGPLELGTVRLETKFGDTAVAVNPKDKRYQKYVGQEIKIDTLVGKRKIKVIADQAVDMEFGTGVVKITPAHDPDDFEVWQRHKSEIPKPVQAIDRFGKLTDKAGPYKGMKVLEARKIIAEDMAKAGLLDPAKTDIHYKHNVAVCYKCGSLIEPMILDNQWFIKTTAKPKNGKLSLRDAAVKAVKKGEVKFVSKRFEKIFFHWMKNLKDWNISRQIPWGIRIPGSQDVFDTWFSSGQWPFATLKTTGKNDFKTFYPTSVMETAWDILFFWVARMIMFGLYCTGKKPFKHVYIHGLVRDKDRQKMSKSKGNVIDPLGIINEQGADALRMSLVFGTGAGNDIIVSEDKVVAQKRFTNKLWQASKFVLANLGNPPTGGFDPVKVKRAKYSKTDQWILKELAKTTEKVTQDIDKFRFHEAAQSIYQFFWHKFCDKTIENVKIRIREKTKDAQIGKFTLLTVLFNSLKLLHPFLPFITEEIYQKLPIKNKKKCLMIEEWPNTNFKF